MTDAVLKTTAWLPVETHNPVQLGGKTTTTLFANHVSVIHTEDIGEGIMIGLCPMDTSMSYPDLMCVSAAGRPMTCVIELSSGGIIGQSLSSVWDDVFANTNYDLFRQQISEAKAKRAEIGLTYVDHDRFWRAVKHVHRIQERRARQHHERAALQLVSRGSTRKIDI